MNKTRGVYLFAMLAAACSDDGLLQGQPTSGTTGTGTGTNSASATEGGGSDSNGVQDSGDAGESATGGTTTGPGTGSTGPATGPGTGSSTGSGSDSSTGSGSGSGSSTGTGTDTEVCDPITNDPSDIGSKCVNDDDCEPGYTCQPFNGFVFEQSCQILCEDDCECPMGLTRNFTKDKMGSWYQCG